MENIMNAASARAIAKKHGEENKGLEEILRSIAKEAEDGKFFLEVRDYGFLVNRPLNGRQKRIVDKLHELGYETEVKYEENYLLDVYLEIRW